MESKKRKKIIALLLSIITPGLGQIYNGQLKKGVIFYLAGFLLIFLLAMTGLQYQFYGAIALVLIAICWRLFIISDALFVAIKIKERTLRPYNKWFIYLLIAIFANVASLFTNDIVKTTVLGVKAYKIPSGTMEPSLLVGDHIVVNLKYFKTNRPQRGDVIVFKYPLDPNKDFIKRVIGIGGDRIEIKEKKVYINGQLFSDPHAHYQEGNPSSPFIQFRDNLGPIVVPKNALFVMGDNRDRSYDSRFWGFVNLADVKGRVMYIYWSKNKNRIGLEVR